MHGEEIARIIELRDQAQLLLDHAADFERDRIRIAPGQPLFSQFAQAVIRFQAIGDLVGILIAQLIKRERAGLGDPNRIGNRVRIGLEQAAHLELGFDPINRGLLANAGQDIGQLKARGGMHDDIAERDGFRPHPLSQRLSLSKSRIITAIIVRQQADKDMVIKGRLQRLQSGLEIWPTEPDQNTSIGIVQHVLKRQLTGAFDRPALAQGEQSAELAEGLAMPRISQQLSPIGQHQTRRDTVRQFEILGCTVSANYAGKRVPVSDGESAQPDLAGPRHQLFSMRSARKESEIADGKEFDIAHANSPTTYQSSVSSPG